MTSNVQKRHVLFNEGLPRKGRKTTYWTVRSAHDGGHLGHIEWYSPWRQYCFFTIDNRLFNPDCLMEIAHFTAQATRNRREAAKETA